MPNAPHPIDITLQKRSRRLRISFSDGKRFELAAEYLRVFSPSAEVQGHGGGEGVLVAGKEAVNIDKIEPVGRYAVRLVFDDGHNTGLYTWPILYDLGLKHESNWRRYLTRLEEAGHRRLSAEPNDGQEEYEDQ
ncbi:MAG: DUF971 domain-containing protein [Gammaproteobacteria bacterium]